MARLPADCTHGMRFAMAAAASSKQHRRAAGAAACCERDDVQVAYAGTVRRGTGMARHRCAAADSLSARRWAWHGRSVSDQGSLHHLLMTSFHLDSPRITPGGYFLIDTQKGRPRSCKPSSIGFAIDRHGSIDPPTTCTMVLSTHSSCSSGREPHAPTQGTGWRTSRPGTDRDSARTGTVLEVWPSGVAAGRAERERADDRARAARSCARLVSRGRERASWATNY